MAPRPAVRPRSPFRWVLGLLLASLPRRGIPLALRDLFPGGADQSFSNPGRDADPRHLGRLSNQILMLGK